MPILRIKKILVATLFAVANINVCAGTLAEIQHVGVMSFCLNPDAMPYSQRDSTEGQPGNGFLYDISLELIKSMGLSARVVWLNSLERLNKTDCDLVPSALVEKKELDEQAAKILKNPEKTFGRLFTLPYSQATGFLVSREKSYQTLESLSNTHVAVPSGSYAQVILNKMKIPVWVRFLTDEDIVNAVKDGEAGAGLVTKTGFEWYVQQFGDPGLHQLNIDIAAFEIRSDIGMVLRNSDANMLGLVNKKLTELKNQGLISKAMKKYGIEHLPPDF